MEGVTINDNVILQLLNEYERDAKWFFRNYESLKKKFRGKYVLVKNKEVKAVANSMEELKRKAKKLNLNVATSVVKFIPKKDIVVII